MGAAAVAEEDHRPPPVVDQDAFTAGPGEVLEGHPGRPAPRMALFGVAGAPAPGPAVVLEAPGDALQNALHPSRKLSGVGLLAPLGALDRLQHRLAPAHHGSPGDGVQAVVEVFQGLAFGPRSQDVEGEPALATPFAPAHRRRQHLEGQGQDATARAPAAGSAQREPAGGHLAVDAVIVLSVAEGGEELAAELPAGGEVGDQLGGLAIESVDPEMFALQQPLAEIEKAGDAARAVAGEHLAGVRRRGVLALRRRAAQAPDPARTKSGTVGEHRVELVGEGAAETFDRFVGDPLVGNPEAQGDRQLDLGARQQVSMG